VPENPKVPNPLTDQGMSSLALATDVINSRKKIYIELFFIIGC
jgi:hypothetical protein